MRNSVYDSPNVLITFRIGTVRLYSRHFCCKKAHANPAAEPLLKKQAPFRLPGRFSSSRHASDAHDDDSKDDGIPCQ